MAAAGGLQSVSHEKILMEPITHETIFSASLGARERLLTHAVGYGVGIGLPVLLGATFALAFSQPLLLLFPVPFVLAFGMPYFLRPRGYAVNSGEIAVIRTVGRTSVPLDRVRAVLSPATSPPGLSIGLARVEGIHGTFGRYWNKTWGRYQVFITNHVNTVELRLENGSRVILSPDDSKAFLVAVRTVASARGIPIVSLRSRSVTFTQKCAKPLTQGLAGCSDNSRATIAAELA